MVSSHQQVGCVKVRVDSGGVLRGASGLPLVSHSPGWRGKPPPPTLIYNRLSQPTVLHSHIQPGITTNITPLNATLTMNSWEIHWHICHAESTWWCFNLNRMYVVIQKKSKRPGLDVFGLAECRTYCTQRLRTTFAKICTSKENWIKQPIGSKASSENR